MPLIVSVHRQRESTHTLAGALAFVAAEDRAFRPPITTFPPLYAAGVASAPSAGDPIWASRLERSK